MIWMKRLDTQNNLTRFTMDREMLRRIEEWATHPSSYLSTRTDYARGYRDGIERAKEIVLEIMTEVEETY